MSLFGKMSKNNKKGKITSGNAEIKNIDKSEIMKMIYEQQRQKSLSDHFASGAVFDIVRQQRYEFKNVVESGSAVSLLHFFTNAYILFSTNPSVVGFSSPMVNQNNCDTDLRSWNADIFKLETGDFVALCFIPIENDKLSARIVGIVLSDIGDGYYYCMLNKDKTAVSSVMRNKAWAGIENVGKINGQGFELMNNFLNCIVNNYYQ